MQALVESANSRRSASASVLSRKIRDRTPGCKSLTVDRRLIQAGLTELNTSNARPSSSVCSPFPIHDPDGHRASQRRIEEHA